VADKAAVFNTLHRDIEKNPKKSPYYNFYNRKKYLQTFMCACTGSFKGPEKV
jgi:hypothetical protein